MCSAVKLLQVSPLCCSFFLSLIVVAAAAAVALLMFLSPSPAFFSYFQFFHAENFCVHPEATTAIYCLY
jgi:hypothetical protein